MQNTLLSRAWVRSAIGIFAVFALLAGFVFWLSNHGRVKTENASIVAPVISYSPMNPGVLEEIYVKEGQRIEPFTPIAKVGNEIITSKVGGIIATVNHDEGQIFTAATPVATMVNTGEMRLVGKIDEDKGLTDIKIGDPVTFTVDAFGSKQYMGVIDEISATAHQGDVVFNISDKREVKQFDIKARFDVTKYPELKNGMSARLEIFTK